MCSHHGIRAALLAPLGLVGVLVTLPLLAASGTPPPLTVAGIPERALLAYQESDGWCDGLRWELLAGIGWVESGHGTIGGATIDNDTGEVSPWIFGPQLDGGPGVLALPIGNWLNWWGLVGPWQQAVGPMQFLPGTFTASSVDGDEDGATNPHDIDDAVVTAANYLCGGRDGSITDERLALRRYNNSDAYATKVLIYADSIGAAALLGSITCPVAGRVSFIDTWLAPRSGGRQHQGVDMFAAYGTPVVAPVAGELEQTTNDLGGLSFRLWGDDGNFYYGAHLSAYGSASGQVEAGRLIGYVGTSGNAAGTPPHLHFEIHPGRGRGDSAGAANPTPTVALACADLRLGIGIGVGD